jgi:hypothetical protein
MEFLLVLAPWVFFVILTTVFIRLYSWAKQKKVAAIALMAMVQMFSPDPYAERTIEIVQQDKKSGELKQQEDGDSLE